MHKLFTGTTRRTRAADPAGRRLNRDHRVGSRGLAPPALEQRLAAEFCRYSQDVPESAFPSFLESLHYDTLN